MKTIERKQWSESLVENELRSICRSLGYFPSVSQLRELGKNDLCCAITRSGGFISWSKRIGIDRLSSDSDKGWAGEQKFMSLLFGRGYPASKPSQIKSPFDILVDGVLRIDVKTAVFAQYGNCRGWFYRLGKFVQSDLVILYQADSESFIALPWHFCPASNITIASDGGKYKNFLNNWNVIDRMLEVRRVERKEFYPLSLKALALSKAA